jgi:hypothetical protein
VGRGETKFPDKLAVDPGHASFGREVQFAPVSTNTSQGLKINLRRRVQRGKRYRVRRGD